MLGIKLTAKNTHWENNNLQWDYPLVHFLSYGSGEIEETEDLKAYGALEESIPNAASEQELITIARNRHTLSLKLQKLTPPELPTDEELKEDIAKKIENFKERLRYTLKDCISITFDELRLPKMYLDVVFSQLLECKTLTDVQFRNTTSPFDDAQKDQLKKKIASNNSISHQFTLLWNYYTSPFKGTTSLTDQAPKQTAKPR